MEQKLIWIPKRPHVLLFVWNAPHLIVLLALLYYWQSSNRYFYHFAGSKTNVCYALGFQKGRMALSLALAEATADSVLPIFDSNRIGFEVWQREGKKKMAFVACREW